MINRGRIYPFSKELMIIPPFETSKFCTSNYNTKLKLCSHFRLALKGEVNNTIGKRHLTKWRWFCKSQPTLLKLTKIDTDDRNNTVKKITKFQSSADIFYAKFDVMSDNLWRHNSVNIDDVISKSSHFTSLHKAYLLVKFHDQSEIYLFVPQDWVF